MGIGWYSTSRAKGRWYVHLTHTKISAGCVSAGAESGCLPREEKSCGARLGVVWRRRPGAGYPCWRTVHDPWPSLDWDSCGGETVPVTPVWCPGRRLAERSTRACTKPSWKKCPLRDAMWRTHCSFVKRSEKARLNIYYWWPWLRNKYEQNTTNKMWNKSMYWNLNSWKSSLKSYLTVEIMCVIQMCDILEEMCYQNNNTVASTNRSLHNNRK